MAKWQQNFYQTFLLPFFIFIKVNKIARRDIFQIEFHWIGFHREKGLLFFVFFVFFTVTINKTGKRERFVKEGRKKRSKRGQMQKFRTCPTSAINWEAVEWVLVLTCDKLVLTNDEADILTRTLYDAWAMRLTGRY